MEPFYTGLRETIAMSFNKNKYVNLHKFRLRFNMSKQVLAVNFAQLPSDKTKRIFSVHEK